MPRGGRRNSTEKPKDFKKAILRLFKELGKFKFQIIVAVLFAVASAVLSIKAPGQLSKLTDEITKGITG